MRRGRITAAATAGVLAVGGLVAPPGVASAAAGRARTAVHDDFDGDGVADVAIGSSGARKIRVQYSSATVDHLHTAYLHVPGRERFLLPSLTPGDYNGDGVDDLAVGDSRYHRRGAVFVYLGSRGGLDDRPATTLEGPHPGPDTHWVFGGSLAAGDVDGDGYDDLAVGQVQWTDQDPDIVGGMVHVYRGSPGGPSKVNPLPVRHGLPAPAAIADVDGDGHPDLIANSNDYARGVLVFAGTVDGFAARPAAVRVAGVHVGKPGEQDVVGDVNRDGYPDVLVGAWTAGHGGALVVLFGGPDGLSGERSQVVFEQQVHFQTGHNFDAFGSSVGIGHISGHRYPDVVVGATGYESAGGESLGGSVLLLHGSAHGLSLAHRKRYTLATPGVPGSPSPGAGFGAALSVADFTGDGHDDMVIGAPGSTPHGRTSAGFVIGLRGSASGQPTKPFSTVAGTRANEGLGDAIA